MSPATTAQEKRNARQRAHDRLDHFLDLAEREQLWGKINSEILIQQGRIVKLDFAPVLGEKFDG